MFFQRPHSSRGFVSPSDMCLIIVLNSWKIARRMATTLEKRRYRSLMALFVMDVTIIYVFIIHKYTAHPSCVEAFHYGHTIISIMPSVGAPCRPSRRFQGPEVDPRRKTERSTPIIAYPEMLWKNRYRVRRNSLHRETKKNVLDYFSWNPLIARKHFEPLLMTLING